MAASPLSRRIKDLEHELGHRLFDRDTHRVTLTQAGSALLPIARGVLEQVDSIRWRLDETARPRRATLLLGVPSGVHPDLRERTARSAPAWTSRPPCAVSRPRSRAAGSAV
ncbi:DNA-binding transcriptional LysR family regulator [Streptomyces canus]